MIKKILITPHFKVNLIIFYKQISLTQYII